MTTPPRAAVSTRAAITAGALIAGFTFGCAPAVPPPAESTSPPPSRTPGSVSPEPSRQDSAIVVARYDSRQTDGGMQSELVGVGDVEDTCFHIRDAETGELVIPVYPSERVLTDNGRQKFGDTWLADQVGQTLTGGFVETYDRQSLPAACRSERQVFVVADF